MCLTDPTQETCVTLNHADYTALIRQRDLDHIDQGSVCPETSRSCMGIGDIWRCETVNSAHHVIAA